MGVSIYDERQPILGQTIILLADGTAWKTLVPASSGLFRVDDVLVTNSDTIAHDVELSIRTGGAEYIVGSVTIPAGQGYLGTPPIKAAATLAPTGQGGWIFTFNQDFRIRTTLAMVGAFALHCVVQGGTL